MDIRIPPLQAPYRSVLNPYVREADKRVIDWVRAQHLEPPGDWAEGYQEAKFTWFAARCFPEADLPQLAMAAAFNVWFFLLDDSCDEVPPGQKYEHVRHLASGIALVMAGYGPSGDPLILALADLWQRLKILGPPDWQEHFTDGLLRYLDACKLEALWVDTDAWPTLPSYTRNRPYLGAVHMEPALAEVLCGYTLTRASRKDPRVDTLTLLCCNIVCWSNDLFSLQKEWASGDKGNLALVLQRERRYSLEEAIRDAAFIHDEDIRHFAGLAREVEAGAPTALRHYVHSLQHIISANMEWSIYDSKRYRFAFAS